MGSLLKKKKKEIFKKNSNGIPPSMFRKAVSSAAKSYREEFQPLKEEEFIKYYLTTDLYNQEDRMPKVWSVGWPLLGFSTKFLKSPPSDRIEITDEKIHDSLISIWNKSYDSAFMPADLFHAGTIPLQDIIIHEKYRGDVLSLEGDRHEKDIDIQIRVHIFPDFKERMERNPKAAVVGLVIHYSDMLKESLGRTFVIYSAMIVDNIHDNVFLYGFGTERNTQCEAAMRFYIDRVKEDLMGFMMNLKIISMCWYGIQLSLLNPKLKVLVQKAKETSKGTIPMEYRSPHGGHKISYVRNIVLGKDFAETVKSSHIFRQRIWWVIGHWRQYKNGKRIFINGYWKGVDRKKKASIKTRDRDVEVERDLELDGIVGV